MAERLNAGLRTLIPNQRGYVNTARPGQRRAYTVAEVAADDRTTGRAEIDRAHIVGHDWAAFRLSRRSSRPERIASLTVPDAASGRPVKAMDEQPGPHLLVPGVLPTAVCRSPWLS